MSTTDLRPSSRYSPSDYLPEEKLFRAYRLRDINEGAHTVEANAISFPDFSCNWSRFSTAEDVRKRDGGLPTDGCFSFSVDVARFEAMATACHDPIQPNFAHTEVRQLKPSEPVSYEPPKGRKLDSHNWSKTNRLRYRQHIVNYLAVEFRPTA